MEARFLHSRLSWARIFLALGLAIRLGSRWETVTHIGNPDYVLPTDFPEGSTHAWYHAFREVCGDAAHMAIFLVVFFGPSRARTPAIWWIILVLMLGHYTPFWIGEPFLPALSAPNATASSIHILMAGFAFLGLFLARSTFMQGAGETAASSVPPDVSERRFAQRAALTARSDAVLRPRALQLRRRRGSAPPAHLNVEL